MKYDDASWHYGGDFPKELPPKAGATHIGMFLSWCVLNGLVGKFHSARLLPQLRARAVTPGDYFIKVCDEKLTDEDLSDEGNAFAAAYFGFETGEYLGDYERVLCQHTPSLYHVDDTWENFDKLAPIIHEQFLAWKANR